MCDQACLHCSSACAGPVHHGQGLRHRKARQECLKMCDVFYCCRFYDICSGRAARKHPARLPPRRHQGWAAPGAARLIALQYSRLGVEDFNFQQYNQTDFCGLEIHIPNAYCNAMLQVPPHVLGHVCNGAGAVLHPALPRRHAVARMQCCLALPRLVFRHAAQENCIACELGFLFHMLDQVPGRNCQVSPVSSAPAAHSAGHQLPAVLPCHPAGGRSGADSRRGTW